MANINWAAIHLTVASDGGGQLKRAAEQRANEVFEDAVIGMQLDFDSHPVTREIAGGVASPNLSNTLTESPGGTNNLYSFIGFEASKRGSPLDPIWRALNPENDAGPKLRYKEKRIVNNHAEFTYLVIPPVKKLIYDRTPLPWADGLSWAQKIETGIPGLRYFLAKRMDDVSRSGGGIQAKDRSGNLVPVRANKKYSPPEEGYLSGIFERFLERAREYNSRGFRARFKTSTGVPR